jgi:hypothetical protein
VQTIQLLQQFKLVSLICEIEAVVMDILDQLLRFALIVSDMGSLINGRQKGGIPERWTDHRNSRAKYHKSGEILVLRSQAIRNPGSHGGPSRLDVSGVHHEEGRLMNGKIRMH